MKRLIFPAISICFLLLYFVGCKPDKPVNTENPNDPDSLYIGTTYRITKELDITITDICEMSDEDILKLLDLKSTLRYIRSTLI